MGGGRAVGPCLQDCCSQVLLHVGGPKMEDGLALLLASVFKGRVYSLGGLCRKACFIVLAFGDVLLFNVSFR